ncbi:gliding motility-associated C-terminal domain-containing protein [Capnocytophaga sp.]|uniref:T9SS type B sorting domain-containing protein n=1 Tax=Capnocytophaga sp. TaxID=44737 RepID=UPI0026DDC193|nr:gliding motility-associated C-terminal domain-containing protein [Capnocytophaga sp.]MDO5105598.1 gliding motility-associated C-terminal domain-containing protein [Capnocytophaga sp.]
MEKIIKYVNMKCLRFIFMTIFSLVSGLAVAQVTFPPNGVTVTIGDNYGLVENNYELGKLTVQVQFGTAADANVTITFPQGITMKPNSLTKTSGTGTIESISETASTVTFTIKGASGTVNFSLDKLISPEAHQKARSGDASYVLQDKVQITQSGSTQEEKTKVYSYAYPILGLSNVTANNMAVMGENSSNFSIQNSGNGKAQDIYLVVEYPSNITHNEVSMNGTALPQISNVGNKYIFKINKSAYNGGAGLINGQTPIALVHKYNVTARCVQNAQIKYIVNWGEGDTEDTWYQNSGNEALRTVSSEVGAPSIEITRRDTSKPNINHDNIDYKKTYYTVKGGQCVAEGGVMGTLRVSYTNYGQNTTLASAIYDLSLYLRENRGDNDKAFFKPANARVGVASLPLTAITTPNALGPDKIYKVDFSKITSDPDGVGEGLDDLDKDGVFDDLPSGATFVLEYDLVKNVSAAESNDRCVTSNLSQGSHANYFHYDYSSYASYQTKCGDHIGGSAPNPLSGAIYHENRSFRRYYHITDGSFTPGTLHKGASALEGRFLFGSSAFYVHDIGSTGINIAKWRIQYKITLPTGVKASNIKWYNADGYPATEPSKQPDVSSVLAGNQLTILAPENNKRGYVTMDFEADCGNSVTDAIQYEIYILEDYGTSAQCATKLVCGSKPVEVICTVNCGNDGPIMIETSGERAENSLGWTDHTMQTRHTKVSLKAVNPLMLKRSLHHDDIEITARGKQARGTTGNLYYTFTTNKGVSLAPKSIVVKIMSGTLSGTIRTLTPTEANVVINGVGTGSGLGRQNKITWNLTPALNGSALQPEDLFEVVATYQVGRYSDINEIYLVNSEERLVGQSSYFYMLDAANKEQYCGAALTPEMYTSLTTPFDGSNGDSQKISGCTKNNIGGGYIAFMARRVQSSNTKLIGEFRPDRLLKQMSFTLPKTFVVSNPMTYYLYATQYNKDGVAIHNTVNIPLSDYTKTESGGFVTYTIQNTYNPVTKTYKLPPGLLVNHNAYSAQLRVEVVGSCDSPEVHEERGRVTNNLQYYDYFYHYGITQSDGTNAPIYNDSKSFRVLMENKPGVTLSVSGNTTLEVGNLAQEVRVKLTNKSALSPAPYTWLSIPDVQGIEVLSLEEITGTTRQAIGKVATITGESMFYLSGTGLPSTGKEYVIRVRLTNCSNATMKVLSGWNCSSFPTGSSQTCSSLNDSRLADSEKSITLVHTGSEIQLKRTITPNPDTQDPTRAKLHMCADNWYEYEINSGGDSDVVEPKISIAKEVGVTVANVEIYYPFNATSPTVLTSRDEGTAVVYDLLPTGQVLLGRRSTNDENQRKVRVRVNIKPDCDFRGGSTFGMEVLGKNACGGALEGTRDNAITASIDGVAEANYKVINTLTHSSGDANNCASGAVYEGKHSITATAGTTTQDGGRVVIRIPQGFKMVAGTFSTKAQSGTFSLAEVVLESESGTALPSGGTEYRIKVPKNMANDNWFTYQFTVKQPDGEKATNCEKEVNIEYYTVDTVGSVPCPGSVACTNITTATSDVKKVAVKADRPSLSIKNIVASSQPKNNKEELTIQFDVENTSTIPYTGALKIALFDDTNNNGKVDDNEASLGMITLANQTFAANTTVTGLQGMIELSQEQVCRLRMKITSDGNNCLCDMSDVSVPAPTKVTGLVSDLTLCQTASQQFGYSAVAPSYASYRWSSTNAQAMSYLSADDVNNPTFVYTGADITQNTTFTYTLTVRRTGGCEATQDVVVTLTPAPAAPAVSPLVFCKVATGADLTPTIASGHKWYTTAKGGTPIVEAQVLSTGTYYVSTTNGGCESLRASVSVVVSANQTPRGALSEVSLCEITTGNVTVAQLKAKILALESGTGITIKVYNGTQLLNDTDVLTSGTTYKYTRNAANECESDAQDITLILEKASTPVGDTKQSFCVAGTVADLKARYTGNVLVYANAGDTTPLNDTNALTTAAYYLRTIENGKCPSDALMVNVSVVALPKPRLVTVTQPTCTSNLGSVELADLPTGSWTITYGTVSVSGNGTTYTINNLSTGNYNFIVTNSDGCSSESLPIYIVSEPTTLPDPTHTVINPECATTTGTVIFEGLPVTGWTITYGTQNIQGNASSTTITNLPTGNYMFTVSYSDAQKQYWKEDFGAGNPVASIPPGAIASSYTYADGQGYKDIMNDGLYSIAQPNSGIFDHKGGAWHTPPADHSGLPNGRYLGVNLGAIGGIGNVYTRKIENIVPNEKIKISFARFNLLKVSGESYKIKLAVYNNSQYTGTPLYESEEISDPVVADEYWKVFETPAINAENNTELYFVISSHNTSTNGNDILIDDIEVFRERVCSKSINVNVTIQGDTTPPDLTVPAELTIVCSSVTATTAIQDWLTQAVATDTCSVTVTNDYDAVKPADLCSASVVTVTFTAKDDTGNVVTKTSTIRLIAHKIDAKDDTFGAVSGSTGGVAGNVLDDNTNGADTLGGNNVTISDVTMTVVTPATPNTTGANVPALDPATGVVTVPANTPEGTYTIVYSICEKLNPTNCDTATATVVVDKATLVANPDDFSTTPISGTTGGNTPNVLDNDTLNGNPLNPTDVTLTWGTPPITNLTPNTNGTITVAPNTPAGTYTLTYEICEKLNPTNCKSTTVTVVVSAQPIDAKDDTFAPINGKAGGSAGNVLNDNGNGADTLGSNPATTTNVIISEVTPPTGINGSTTVPTLNTATGEVTVPADTPAGTYTIVYSICEQLNPNNCDTATATVVVTAQPIDAKDDTLPSVDGKTGGNAGNVLGNNGNGTDTLGGNPATTTDVTITEVTPPTGINGSTTVPTLDVTTGNVNVPANTPAGTYTIVYSICEKLNPSNCDTATITVVVTTQQIDAKDDSFGSMDGQAGGVAGNVLDDNTNGADTLGGNNVPISDVTMAVVTPAAPNTTGANVPALDPTTGIVTVPANTPAGTYTIVYSICEKLNPTNCDTATATVVVTAQPIDAQDDSFEISASSNGKVGNVLSDNGNGKDTLGGNDATTTNVVISEVTPAVGIGGSTIVPTLDVTTGDVTVPANTPEGTYTIVYRICEQLNPSNCDTATATIVVTPESIKAQDDDFTAIPIYEGVGGTVTTTILENDTLYGGQATLANVTISNPTSPMAGIEIDTTTGLVVVQPNVPVGVYTLTYHICEQANTSNCSNVANVVVRVLGVPKANDDKVTTGINEPAVVNVLENDENVPTQGTLTIVTDPTNGSVQINDGGTPNDPSDDTVTYTPNSGFIGTDTFVYQLCDAAGNCSTATVTVDVEAGGDITPYNAISVNDDGSNDVFYIKGIESYPNNTVRIYNRWGVKVFEERGYNNTTKAFRGLSNGRVTIQAPEKLPQGTYYYVIEYVDNNNQTKRKGSWLYIKH